VIMLREYLEIKRIAKLIKMPRGEGQSMGGKTVKEKTGGNGITENKSTESDCTAHWSGC